MFSKELYELDKNTVQYMMDEMQDTIDAQKEELEKQQGTIERIEEEKEKIRQENEEIKKKQQEERENTIIKEINLLRSFNVSEEKIVQRICDLHQINEEQIKKYLNAGNPISRG